MLSCFSYLELPIDDFCQAAERGDVETVRRLLSHGVSPDVRGGRFSATPLHYTIYCNSTEVTELLLQYNADIEARDKINRTALHHAALGNRREVAELLLQHNANNEAKNIKSNTSPQCCIAQQHRSC